MKNSWIAILVIAVIGCTVGSGVHKDDYSFLYNKESVISPEFKLYHTNEDSSEIIFKVKSADLIYSRKNQDSPYQSKFQINYRLYTDLDSKIIDDSATVKIVDVNPTKKHKLILGSIKFPFGAGRSAVIRITTTDLQRGQEHRTLKTISKQTLSGEENFLVVENGVKLTRPYLTGNDSVLVYSERNKNSECVVQWFDKDFGVAKPPFANNAGINFDFMPDQIFPLVFNSDGRAKMALPQQGFVLLERDTSHKEGMALFRFDKNYPEVFDASGLAEPLRYICSNDEYDALLGSDNQKLAVEQYWLEKCKSKERAREIIKEYYSRVNNANTYFTSYVEGWKTDRGMISIIYGKPASIEKRNNYEIWRYGQGPEYQSPTLAFTFYKRNNPFTGNDYKLRRDFNYKPGWYRALDTWRSGRVFKAGV